SLSLRDETEPGLRSSRTRGIGTLTLVALLLGILGGIVYWIPPVGLPFLQTPLGRAPAETATAPLSPAPPAASEPSSLPPLTAPAEPAVMRPPTDDSIAPASSPPRPAGTASILIFSPRPGSITTGRPTELCYAVSDALEARVDPGVGEVTPANTLTCVR